MPTTSPSRLSSGPPELPRLIATSVWMKGTYCCWLVLRPLALTMPAVTDCSKLNGEPIATTHSPGFSTLLSPSLSVGRFFASTFSRATSLSGSDPISSASNSRRSAMRTMISSAFSTTW